MHGLVASCKSRWLAVLGSSDRGVSAVEYSLLITLIAMAIIGAVAILGGSLQSAFNSFTAKIPSVP